MKNNIESFLQKQTSPHLQIRTIHIFHTFTLINVKIAPRSGKTTHLPIKNYLNLHFELENNTNFYPSTSYTYFLQKFKDISHFLELDSQREKQRLLCNSNSKVYISPSYITTRNNWIHKNPYYSNNSSLL